MKAATACILVFVCFASGLGQAIVGPMWTRTFVVNNRENFNAIRKLPDGGYIMVGECDSTDWWGQPISTCYLVKADSNGSEAWHRLIGQGCCVANDVACLPDGGFLLVGTRYAGFCWDDGRYGRHPYMVRTDSDGDTLWTRDFPQQPYNLSWYATSLSLAPDGGFLCVGYIRNLDGIHSAVWLKTDSLGNIQRTRTYYDATLYAVISTDGHACVAAGTCWTQDQYYGMWLLKLDSLGTQVWSRRYGFGTAFSVAGAMDGGYMLAGNLRVVKVNADGDSTWSHIYDGGVYRTSIRELPNGGHVVAGWNIDNYSWVFRFNQLGDTLWGRCAGGSLDIVTSLAVESDSTYALAGYHGGYVQGVGTAFLTKFGQIRGIRLLAPVGAETWGISDSDTVRWYSSGFQGNVRVELNRNYPSGAWEMIADTTANDGSEPWTVTGPASSHCRIRISSVGDTLTDVSRADFSIITHLTVLSPNGGEVWTVFQMDTVPWSGGGFNTVRIELNRNYPSGEWETLADSTLNDRAEVFLTTDPLSTHCRVRISAIGDTLTDISDGDFSITASQGYLAMARSAAPETPVLNWNAGTLDCGGGILEWFHLKNFGSEAIQVLQLIEPPSGEFFEDSDCPLPLLLSPGQMSACSLRLTFDPASDGTYRDTLLIQTDAVNGVGGYVTIPLSGTQISTPAVPQVVITIAGNDARLNWNRITQSIGGCPVNVTRYLVFLSEVSSGPFWFHGYTADSTYLHAGAVQYATNMFYRVIASTAPTSLLEGIERGEEMEGVLGKIGNRK